MRCLASLGAQILQDSVPQQQIKSGYPCSGLGTSKPVCGFYVKPGTHAYSAIWEVFSSNLVALKHSMPLLAACASLSITIDIKALMNPG